MTEPTAEPTPATERCPVCREESHNGRCQEPGKSYCHSGCIRARPHSGPCKPKEPIAEPVGFECDTCGLKADDLAIVAALRAEVDTFAAHIARDVCGQTSEECWVHCTSREAAIHDDARAILAAREKEKTDEPD